MFMHKKASNLLSPNDTKSWLEAAASLNSDVVARINCKIAELAQHHPTSAQHSERVAAQAVAFARRLGVPEAAAEGIRQPARLHDIGKLHIPLELLDRKGPLAPQDHKNLQLHTVKGARIIETMPGLPASLRSLALVAVLEHHERFDGNGYPNSLAGDSITPLGRLLKVVDVFDAIARRGGYRETTPALDAVKDMCNPDMPGMSGQFDPKLLRPFARMIHLQETRRSSIPSKPPRKAAESTECLRTHLGVPANPPGNERSVHTL
jgi:HD-GYP domain-containing protein (c-di-GMP phosphodiesterase class II)